jgi:hypothetical protein
MRSRILSLAAAVTLAITGLVVAGPASPAFAHCGGHDTHPDRYSGGGVSWGDGTYIRRYPHVDCVADGQGFPAQGIDVHCGVVTGTLWLYVRNTSTGVAGWARYDALRISGTVVIPAC